MDESANLPDGLPNEPTMNINCPDNVTQNSYFQVAGAAVKLSDFNPSYADTWFVIAEAKFADCRITASATKYQKVVQALPLETAHRLHSFFATNPISLPNPYEELKRKLIDMFKQSTAEQFLELIEQQQLGDRRPSELLTDMQRTADGRVTDDFLEPLWLSRLPDHVSAVVSALEVPLVQKGKAADKVMDKLVSRPLRAVAAVNPVPLDSQFTEMQKAITNLSLQVAELTRERGRRFQRRRSVSRRRASSRPRANPDICWFHERFGDQARRCDAPCRYSKN